MFWHSASDRLLLEAQRNRPSCANDC